MASRSLDDLRPECSVLAKQMLAECRERELDLLIYCTVRTVEEQARLWRVGRSRSLIERVIGRLHNDGRDWVADLLRQVGPQDGPRVLTNALPGESAHNYGYAFDAVLLREGKPAWGDMSLLRTMGEIGKNVGLEWAGDWEQLREYVHFQVPQWGDLLK